MDYKGGRASSRRGIYRGRLEKSSVQFAGFLVKILFRKRVDQSGKKRVWWLLYRLCLWLTTVREKRVRYAGQGVMRSSSSLNVQ